MLVYPDEETLLVVNVADGYVDPEERRQWHALVENEVVVCNFETRWRQRDGTVVWVKETARLVRGADRRVLC
jgi:PAS domain-containing protein